jgi:predicted dehydrogenase
MTKVLNVAVIGLGFGAEFIPIYQRHPATNMYAICRRSKEALDVVGDAFGIEKRYRRFEDVLSDPAVDYVHINTPLHTHGALSIAALKAGKHVMCTVPMALSVEECGEIVSLVKSTGLKYMMAETVLYAREYLFMRELYQRGELGELQFLQGSHHQDMDGWPDGWPGLPPMYYATHCISPCLAIAGAEAEYVSCVGSGRISDDLARAYGSPFAVESAHSVPQFRSPAPVTARSSRRPASTGKLRCLRHEKSVSGHDRRHWLVVHTARKPLHETARMQAPDYAYLLPEPIRPFTTKTFLDLPEYKHLGEDRGADPDGTHAHLVADPGSLEGHGGSHPHLVHEFVSAMTEDRDPFPNAVQSANITCAGILSHRSAMANGERIRLPDFALR